MAWSTPRSETAEDQCPGPYSRVSASAAAIRKAAIAGASAAVARTSVDARDATLGDRLDRGGGEGMARRQYEPAARVRALPVVARPGASLGPLADVRAPGPEAFGSRARSRKRVIGYPALERQFSQR